MKIPLSATWLMGRFGVDDVVIGDIHEQAERSTWWFWWQVAGAVLIAIARDFRAHWLLTGRAIIVGILLHRFISQWIAFVLWRRLGGPFIGVAALMGFTHPGVHFATIAMMVIGLPMTLCLGWLLARLHRTRTPLPVLAFLFSTWLLFIPQYSRQVSNAIDDPRFRPYLVTQTIGIAAFSLSVMIGGLWNTTKAGDHG